jgi:hypothetical protein
MRAVGGGEKIRRGRFSGKEQAVVDKCGEHRTVACVAREHGQRNPTVISLWHVAKALGVPVRSFFDEARKRNKSLS